MLRFSKPAGATALERPWERRIEMSYEMMEALLVQKIADLRSSEARVAQSLQAVRNGMARVQPGDVFVHLNAQITEVEQLLALMDSAPLANTDGASSLVAGAGAGATNPSLWM